MLLSGESADGYALTLGQSIITVLLALFVVLPINLVLLVTFAIAPCEFVMSMKDVAASVTSCHAAMWVAFVFLML